MYNSIQTRVMQILDKAETPDKASLWCDYFITAFILLNVTAVILESVPSLHGAYGNYFQTLEFISILVFSVEYVLRAWSSGARYGATASAWRGRREYLLSFQGLVDLAATLPFYLQLQGFAIQYKAE